MSTDISDLVDNSDATGVAAAVRAGEVTPVELVENAISRYEERNDSLNAIVATCFEDALANAAEIDTSLPFAGVPFVVKDLGASIAGLPHTRGSRLWADDIAEEDSELVRRYRAAGFVPVGVTNAPELGRSPSTEPVLHGPCRNPYDTSRSPGGSSGGTAAAIAAGIVPIGHGNDGGGSIRIPASACGLVGLKPSRARTTSAPSLSLMSYPMGVNHVLSRSVRDTAAVLDLSAGPVPGDPYVILQPERPWLESAERPPERLRVAVATETRDGEAFHPECAQASRSAADLLDELGHEVTEASPDYPLDAMAEVMRTLMGVPLAVFVNQRLRELGRELRDDDLEPFTRMMYDAAGTVSGEQVLVALEYVEQISHTIGGFFEDFDILVTPTLREPSPPLGLLDTTDIDAMINNAGIYASLTSPFNTTGQPAISLPLATGSDGMPIGVQLVAAFGREDLLVSVAAQIEQAQPWSITPAVPDQRS